jgi:uncharacterized membrane protein HdeD (DUF308 family)
MAAVFWPGITLVTLVYLFGAYILVSGLVRLVSGIVTSDESFTSRLLVMLLGVLEVGVGVYLLRHPLVTFTTLILLFGFTLIVAGVFDIIAGLFAGNRTTNKLLTVLVGALATITGIIVLFQPASSGVAFVWILGLYALLSGPFLIAMALDLKNSGGNRLRPA